MDDPLSDSGSLNQRAPAEAGEYAGRDRSRPAGADDPTIELDDRDDFSARAGQETLVSAPNVIAGQVGLAHRDVELPGDIENGGAGDALERAGGSSRGDDPTLLHDEQVVGRAYGDIPAVVQYHGLERRGLLAL